jgi:hypothetical protein
MATNVNITQITPPRVPIIDERTGAVSREWYRWFYNIFTITGGSLGITPVINGGTGLGTIPTNGQLLIGNGTGYTLNTLAVGNGISVVNGLGTITLANTGVLSNLAGAGISVSSATGNVTIANTGVLSFSGGATGLTPATTATGVVTLAGTLIAINGGTGFGSYAVGDLLYANTTTTLAKLPDVATGNALISGGVGTAPAWGKIGLTTHVSGVLPIANGGTNGSATPTAYGIAYGTGTAYAFTAAGTAKQVLIANTGAAPTWSTLTTGASILYGDGSGGFSNVTIGTGVSFAGGTLSATGSGGTVTSVTGTSPVNVATGTTTPVISLAAAYGDTLNPYAAKTANYVLAGPTTGAAAVPTFRALVANDIPSLSYVTSVSFTGGIITVATPTTTPAFTVAGTSGGIPYFSSATTWATSAALAANAIVLGGGAGAAPATTTTGTGVVTALGVNTGTAGAFVVNGGALGTPSSGTVTNLTGTASININGTVGATTPAAGTFTSLSDSGNLTFTGTGNRITGDFSNGTQANRVAFQTSTANSATAITVIPNGTSVQSSINLFNNSNPTNASLLNMLTNATDARISSTITGTGTYLPMSFFTGGSERARIDTSGRFLIGTTSSITLANGQVSYVQTAGTDSRWSYQTTNFASTAGSSEFGYFMGRSRGASVGTYTAVASGDQLGTINWSGADGTNLNSVAASITSFADGTVSTGVVPGRILFNTASSAGSLTERMRISSAGIVTMSAYGAGAATFSAAGVISSVSDETWKIKDGVPTDPDAMLKKLEPGYWYYNDEKKETFGHERQLGFYAQNVNAAIGAEAAPTPEQGKPWGYYDRSVLAVTVMSLQKALATIESLTARIKTLENK